jgi:hypothetical protein
VANRDNHYEAAFEAYLRSRSIAYVAVDEAKRSRWAEVSLKSLDFIVSLPGGTRLLVDVKGRRFPSGDDQKQYWKNWSTRDDLVSLAQWEKLFGEPFGAMFVFAYNIVGDRAPLAPDKLFEFRGGVYAFLGVRLGDFARYARPISPRWDTLAVPAAKFRELAAPLDWFMAQAESTAV